MAYLNKIFLLIAAIILVLSVRGLAGNPNESDLNTNVWEENGPMELSPERGRFALTFSIIENKSFYFTNELAKFVTPDLGRKNNHYVSLFAPAVSFLVIPGYVLGKMINMSQVGSFVVISIFALLNGYLIQKIAVKLGANQIAAVIGAIVFLFATPAFAYAVTLYQHHITTFIILFSLYLLLFKNSFWSLFWVWAMLAFSFSVDYPNIILILPLIVVSLGKIFFIGIKKSKLLIKIRYQYLLTILAIIIPTIFLFWVNYKSYDNPLQLAGTIARITDNQFIHSDSCDKTVVRFFKTRNMLNGLYILFISRDRGLIYYTPVVLLGIFGAVKLYKKRPKILSILISIMSFNVLLYSMWGDPWGGWAFGSRYLIPSYAIMAIFLAITISHFKKNILWLIAVFIFFSYSLFVNTSGALTTNAIPPKIEVLELERLSKTIQKYDYQKNIDYLNLDKSKSYIYKVWAKKYVNSWGYFAIISGSIFLFTGTCLAILYYQSNKIRLKNIFSVSIKQMKLSDIVSVWRKYD